MWGPGRVFWAKNISQKFRDTVPLTWYTSNIQYLKYFVKLGIVFNLQILFDIKTVFVKVFFFILIRIWVRKFNLLYSKSSKLVYSQ